MVKAKSKAKVKAKAKAAKSVKTGAERVNKTKTQKAAEAPEVSIVVDVDDDGGTSVETKQDISALRSQLAVKERMINDLKLDIEKKNEEIRNITNQFDVQREDLHSQVARLQTKLESALLESVLESKADTLSVSELDSMKARVEDLEAELKSALEAKHKSKTEVGNLSRLISEREDELVDLRGRLNSFNEINKRLIYAENELKNMKSHQIEGHFEEDEYVQQIGELTEDLTIATTRAKELEFENELLLLDRNELLDDKRMEVLEKKREAEIEEHEVVAQRAELVKELEDIERTRAATKHDDMAEAGWDRLVMEYDELAEEKNEFINQKTELLSELLALTNKKVQETENEIKKQDLSLVSHIIEEEKEALDQEMKDVAYFEVRESEKILERREELDEREANLFYEEMRIDSERKELNLEKQQLEQKKIKLDDDIFRVQQLREDAESDQQILDGVGNEIHEKLQRIGTLEEQRKRLAEEILQMDAIKSGMNNNKAYGPFDIAEISNRLEMTENESERLADLIYNEKCEHEKLQRDQETLNHKLEFIREEERKLDTKKMEFEAYRTKIERQFFEEDPTAPLFD